MKKINKKRYIFLYSVNILKCVQIYIVMLEKKKTLFGCFEIDKRYKIKDNETDLKKGKE